MARPLSHPQHGTRQRYQLRRDPCRCSECSSANSRYVAFRRSLTRPDGQLPLPPELRLDPQGADR